MNETRRTLATAIVVLGCRVLRTREPSATLARRVDHALGLWHAECAGYLLLSGGRAWNGIREAEVMRGRALEGGVPAERVLCEWRSRNTRQNARYSSEILRLRTITSVTLVTSDWHMARALLVFRRVGFAPIPSPVLTPNTTQSMATLRNLREAVHRAVERLTIRCVAK